MNSLSLNKNNLLTVLRKTVAILKKGGLVIFPSDTVYGLLVDSTNQKAVEKLIEFKERPKGKPISVFVSKVRTIDTLCKLNNKQKKILDEIFPGPFTVVLDYKNNKKFNINKLLLSEKNTLGVRIPDFEPVNKLVEYFGKPITATSANTSGTNPYYSIVTLLKNLSDKKKRLIDLLVDAGKLQLNKPSTVVDLTADKVVELRSWDLSLKNVKKYVSNSATDTKKIAVKFIKDAIINQKKPIVAILQGELGSGKTIFTKGAGEYLGIKDIISPSFVTYYEYEILCQKYHSGKSKQAFTPGVIAVLNQRGHPRGVSNKFVHADFYYIKDDDEIKDLKLENYLDDKNILFIEWGEKGGAFVDEIKKRAEIYLINIKYLSQIKREIKIGKLNK